MNGNSDSSTGVGIKDLEKVLYPVRLNERWIKASVLASMWSSFEIVFGSFLHNLKIPFSGNILTAIAVILFVQAYDRWPEKGIILRAGIITALLKTLSPSAVIFGPMVAIFMEAFIFDMTMRVIPGRIPGILIASVLTMSWNLAQRILNLLLFYGLRIIDIYTGIVRSTENQLNLESDIIWIPLTLLFSGYVLFGVLAGAAGLRINWLRKHRKLSAGATDSFSQEADHRFEQSESQFDYSPVWLAVNMTFIAVAFFMFSRVSVLYSGLYVVFVVYLWARRYKRAVRQLLRRKFWISFAVITMLTTLLINPDGSWIHGLVIGIEMNLRAAMVILGFAVLGTELYDPRIRSAFQNSRFRNLLTAMDAALENLPVFISSIPSYKTIRRYPLSVLIGLFDRADAKLADLRMKNKPGIVLISGKIGEGKTSAVSRLIGLWQDSGKNSIGGIITEKDMAGGKVTAYRLRDIEKNSVHSFLSLTAPDPGTKPLIGNWYYHIGAFEFGSYTLTEAIRAQKKVIIIDEFGPLELRGEGWAESLEEIRSAEGSAFIITCRDFLADRISSLFHGRTILQVRLSELDLEA